MVRIFIASILAPPLGVVMVVSAYEVLYPSSVLNTGDHARVLNRIVIVASVAALVGVPLMIIWSVYARLAKWGRWPAYVIAGGMAGILTAAGLSWELGRNGVPVAESFAILAPFAVPGGALAGFVAWLIGGPKRSE